ncbi:DUF3618 domain-containing protein [Sphingomonas sp.]|uniref:DUF3618 domain-containing protein n=1 Tax=Sphingomonas sp. TaxID=28214 RepID=UPI00286B8E5F|nr:DUF3618 domain-containing protein [Sphingomonas sp.]
MNARIIAAEADVAEAREALIDTARELQQRLQPKTLAREAWESAKVKGADLAEDAVDAVKRRPVATGGVIAAIAMFLARDPIKDGVSRLYDAMTSTKESDQVVAKAPARKPAPRRKRSAPHPARKTESK